MRLFPKSLRWRVILLTLLGLTAIGVSVWATFGRAIEAAVRRQLVLLALRDDPHPVTRGLARGEIGPHTSIEELIAAHPPDDLRRSGRYVRATYRSRRGVTHVVAVDGRPAAAMHWGWFEEGATFFDHMTPDENNPFYPMTMDAEWSREVRDYYLAHAALGGVAGHWGGMQYRDPLDDVSDVESEGR